MTAEPGVHPRRWRRRVLATALGLVAALGLLEVALQAASLAMAERSGFARPEGRVVLCLGDSLTAGLGAPPSGAFPDGLQRRMDAALGSGFAVVNAGRPGRSSADVLRGLPRLLEALQPEVAILLVGWNDTWARPAPVRAGDEGPAFRWRTARLVRVVLGNGEQHVELGGALPFLGTWHVGQHSFSFLADGTARLGRTAARWRLYGAVVELTPEGGEPMRIRWRVGEGGSLEFSVQGWHRFQRARRGPPGSDAGAEEILDRIDRGEVAAAIEAARPLLDGPEGAALASRLALALLEIGDAERAREMVAAVESAFDETADPAAGEGLALWFAETGRPSEAREVARRVLERDGGRVHCWRVLVDQGGEPAEMAELERRLDAAIARADSPWPRARLLLERAVVRSAADPFGAMRDVVAARNQGAGPDEVIRALWRSVRRGADPARLVAAASGLAGDDPFLVADVRRATVGEDEVYEVLAAHTSAMVALCREHGCRVVLLGYPFAMDRHQELMARIARTARVPFVSMVEAFAALRAQGRELFSDPVHCNEAGYGVMADRVFECLERHLR